MERGAFMYKAEARGGKAASLTIALFFGGLLALGIEVVILLLGSMAISGGILSETLSSRITAASCVLGCLAGGLYSCRRWGERRLLAGVGAGGVCFLLILAVSLFMGDGPKLGAQALTELACCCCGGAVAGMLSKKKKKRGKRVAGRGK